MVAEIYAGVGAFKAMFDMAKALKDINDAAVRNGAVIELQQQILGAQVEQAALLDRVGYLEKEMTRFETWDAEKQRYVMKEVESGSIAYALKADTANAEPAHWICAGCYHSGRKSVLQNVGDWSLMPRDRPFRRWECPACKNCIKLGESTRPTMA